MGTNQETHKRRAADFKRTTTKNGKKSKVTPASANNESQRESKTRHEEQSHFVRLTLPLDKTGELTTNRAIKATNRPYFVRRGIERQP